MTDTDALTERLIDAMLAEESLHIGVAPVYDMATAVLPIIAAEAQAAKAEALREATAGLRERSKNVSNGHAQIGVEASADWPGRRASEYETGDSDEHR